MRAQVKTGPVSFDAGSGNDVLILAAVLMGGYFFLTRQVVPDAFNAVTAAGGAVSTAANVAANKGAQILTGDPYATAGTAWYNVTHPFDNAGAVATADTYPKGFIPNPTPTDSASDWEAYGSTDPGTSRQPTGYMATDPMTGEPAAIVYGM